MYGEVILVNNSASEWLCLTLCWRDWLDPIALPLPDTQAAERRAAVAPFLASRTRTAPGWREAYKARLEQVAVQVTTPDLIHLGLSLAMEHYQLPTAQQKARADFIDACFQAEFADVLEEGDTWEPLQRLINSLRIRALLMPQALLEHTIREACLTLRCQMLAAALFYDDVLPGNYARPYSWMHNLTSSQDHDLAPALSAAIWTRRAADRSAFINQLDRLQHEGRLDTVRDAWRYVVEHKVLGQQVLVGDFMANVVSEAAAGDNKNTSTEAQLASHWQLVTHIYDCRVERGVMDALATGQTPVVPGYGAANNLRPLLRQWAEMERSSLTVPQNTDAPSLTLSSTQTHAGGQDDRTHAAQCQVKTLGWLQGPIATKGAPAVNVNDLAQRELTIDNPPAPALTKRAKARKKDEANAQQTKVAAVQSTMEVAVLETASFMAGQLDDGLAEAKAAGVTGASVQQAAQCAKSLATLRSAPVTAVKIPSLQQQLYDAEQAISGLRAAIRDARQLQAEDRVVQRLLRCLCQTLNQEALVMGKQHGGVIAFEATPADWGWIAQRLHRRCLLTATRLIINGRSVALGTEHAVGLYVTQSSRSGQPYVFDISVHLWSRRQGCTSPPCGSSLDTDPFPPFIETDWFDTFIPCAVLHLPRKT